MPLFQKSVISKYLKSQDKEKITKQWLIYKNHFHNQTIQENIQKSDEIQYQSQFLTDLFVNIFGYIKNPSPNYNLMPEKTTHTDNTRADGGIIINNKVRAVIELKGMDTKDLSKKVETQAFGYKSKHPNADCNYVITSNFEKLRFYIDDTVEYLEFNLFTINEIEFELLYLCLAFENISKDIPRKIKIESLSEEDVITKKLYKDYSLFKRELHQNLVLLNPDFEPLELFKKSQKLLDRFLFLFFGEDRHLLPPNSVRLILTQWNQLKELDEYSPLYDRFKKYFGYLNTGYKGVQHSVFAYNGGLFKPDELLDTIKIDDDLLYKHTLKLSEYDFASEVDVNILGHIFENSLNELDEIKAQLEGQEIDKSKTKRKKDGVFYTPKYITKYIVDNTVGKLCEEKKQALEILEEEYFTDKKRQKLTIQGLVEKLDAYRKWLLELTICDPACGSGAFLNQALDFLIEEHQYIDELQAKLFGDALVMSDMENSILENNLFGVDLNEESVEIAKLSLWLRTAQPNRKLNDLNGNIKCGNSLIDDVEVAGEKAFNWEQGFPKVFEKGGFDVIIGNPPYVNARNMDTNERVYLINKHPQLSGSWDIYVPFLLMVSEISKNNCYGWIIPNKLLISDYAKNTLEFLIKLGLNKVINISHLPIFENVGVYPIILINNNESDNYKVYEIEKKEDFANVENYEKKENNFKRYKTIKEFNVLINSGTTGFEAQKIKPLINENNEGIDFAVSGSIDPYKIDLSNVPYMKSKYIYPKIIINKDILASSKIEFWLTDKIVVAGMTKRLECYFTNNPLALGVGVYGIYGFSIFSPLFLLSVLNSKFITFYLIKEFKDKHLAGGYLAINKSTIEQLPLVEISHQEQYPFIENAELMLTLNKELQDQSQKFLTLLQSDFNIEKPTTKIENWYNLTWSEFEKELNKLKIILLGTQKEDWLDRFNRLKTQAQDLQNKINQTDKAIDKLVYELYGLSEEEIAIVENS